MRCGLAKESYGWPTDEPFHVPAEVRERYAECVERGAELERDWRERAEVYRTAYPELWSEFERIVEARLPEGWDADPPRFTPEDGSVATRKASGPGAPVGGWGDPAPGRRLGRPGRVERDADQGGRQRRPGRLRRVATSTSACASTPWGRS